jgi:hypothetical protein
LIGLLAGVDACLGPFLTLLVFKAGKPGLKFDLAVIAALQLGALGYGLYSIFLARPVYVAFTVDRFELVRPVDIPEENLKAVRREEYENLPVTGPKWVAVKRPDDPKERERIMFSAIAGGADWQSFPQYYVPYDEMRPTVLERIKPLEPLMSKSDQARRVLDGFGSSRHLELSQVGYLPLRSIKRDQTVLLDKRTASVLGVVDLEPW